MEENILRVSSRELFYSAMLLRLERVVNVEYDFPADEAVLRVELEDAKRSLHKKKLLKENSKGEITLDHELAVCAAYCARPDNCAIVEEEGITGAVYCTGDAVMLLERAGEDVYEVRWFPDAQSADGFIARKLEKTSAEEVSNHGGA